MTAIATLTQRAETAQTGSVHEWRGPLKAASPDLIDYLRIDESIEQGCIRHRIARQIHGAATRKGIRAARKRRATCFRPFGIEPQERLAADAHQSGAGQGV